LPFFFHLGQFLGNDGFLDVGIGQGKLKHGARKYRRWGKICWVLPETSPCHFT
jgi:hypothetical protein